MYIQLVSVHGLIRGTNPEMGRDGDTGGQVTYVLEFAKTLAQHDAVTKVDLFTRQIRDKALSKDYGQRIEEIGPRCRIVRIPCGGGRYIRKEKLWPTLDEFVANMIAFTRKERQQPAIVHGHYADAGYIAREIAQAFGIPFVFTGHSLGRDKLAYLLEQGSSIEQLNRELNIEHRIKVEEQSLASASLVVSSTRHERDTQYQRYENAAKAKFAVIPPGTDLERFFPYYDYEIPGERIETKYKQARVRMQSELNRFHFQQDKPIVLALCRPDKRKNIHALVQAYGEDKELQAFANLAVFAGIRSDIEEMEESEQQVLTEILLLMDRYDLYGRMAIPKRHDSQTDVPELYRLAASLRGVFVNAAFVEPFGLTFIEASATGLPFVGTENGGPQDIRENCESGLLVDVSDPNAIGAAVRNILTDSQLWQTLSNNGINRVREHYSWYRHCDTYVEHVKELSGVMPVSIAAPSGRRMSTAERLSTVEYVLISDIDNTLLGDPEGLEELRKVLEQNWDRLAFGVASGRYLEKVLEALQEAGIPSADVIISSVGTEIRYGDELDVDNGWSSVLRHRWRRERVQAALEQVPFLTYQEDALTQLSFKVSYNLDDAKPPDEALPEIHRVLQRINVPYSLIFSHGSFIDVLPQRASKGKAVKYLSEKWQIPMEKIATAGDSGNDRDMLTGKTAGIVVGNHDAELEALRRSGARVYFAQGRHANGILEGLRHYRFIA